MTYTLESLIDKAYDILNVPEPKNDQIIGPIIYFQNKKTFFSNFTIICKDINRNTDVIQKYINDELCCVTSIDNKGALVMNGKFTIVQVRKCITSYIEAYIDCKQCKSRNTEIVKENRINYIKCKNCTSSTAF